MNAAMESLEPTPYAVYCYGVDPGIGLTSCNEGRLIYLTEEFYEFQMSMPDARWKCPRCRGDAGWSDDNFEERSLRSEDGGVE